MKKLVSLLLCLLLTLSCVTAMAQEPLRISWWGSGAVNAFQLELCDMYKAKFGIEYEAEYVSWADYWTKMNTLAASSDLPDVMRQDYGRIAPYAEKGLLMDMTPLVEAGKIDLSNVPANAISNGYFDGKLLAINVGSNALGLIFNKKLIEDAGMEPIPTDATWADFIQYCLDYHEKSGGIALTLATNVSTTTVLNVLVRGQGQQLYNDEQTAFGFDRQLLVDYFASLKTLHDAGAMDPAATLTVTISNEDSSFAKAESAMMFDWTDPYATYDNLLKETYGGLGLTIVPGASNGGMYIKPSALFSIPVTSENVDAAATFINYWINDEEANLFLSGRRGIPISSVCSELVAQSVNDTAQRVFEYINKTIQPHCSDIFKPFPAASSEIDSEMQKQVQLLLFGETDAETAATTLFETAEKLLNE